MNINSKYKKLIAYSGYYKDNLELLSVASGGAASILAETVIAKGGIVYGAIYSRDFKRAEYGRFKKNDDLKKFKSSKYISAEKKICVDGKYKSVYIQVAEDLSAGKEVLFTGLGCDVAALKKYIRAEKISDLNLYTIDVICHGPMPQIIADDFINMLEKRYKSKIISFNVKCKKHGWSSNPYIYASFENGRKYEKKFYNTDYGYAFSKLIKKPCYKCQFKGENHLADITVGDYWGLQPTMKAWNKYGVSLILVRTGKGEELIKQIDYSKFYYEEADLEFALEHNPMYWKSKEKDYKAEEFERILYTEGLHSAVRKTITFKENIRRTNIYSFLKKICG